MNSGDGCQHLLVVIYGHVVIAKGLAARQRLATSHTLTQIVLSKCANCKQPYDMVRVWKNCNNHTLRFILSDTFDY